jgi:hypothetical protein
LERQIADSTLSTGEDAAGPAPEASAPVAAAPPKRPSLLDGVVIDDAVEATYNRGAAGSRSEPGDLADRESDWEGFEALSSSAPVAGDAWGWWRRGEERRRSSDTPA